MAGSENPYEWPERCAKCFNFLVYCHCPKPVTPSTCDGMYWFGYESGADNCQLEPGHDGPHRYLHEWTDAEAEEAERRGY